MHFEGRIETTFQGFFTHCWSRYGGFASSTYSTNEAYLKQTVRWLEKNHYK
jgi:hypothetical protein